jgi:formamidopyrimidine-DNA glycosylase
LHVAGLSPLRRASVLATPAGAPRDAASRLAAAVKQVLQEAVARQTGRDYRDSRFLVYEREDEPCLKADCHGVIRRRTQSGRSTYYCPVCQR